MAKKITDIDELIKARKDELKKLQEKKFNQKFKPIIDIFKKYNNDYKKYYNIFDNTVEFKLCCAFIGEICSNNDFQVSCYKIKSEKFSKSGHFQLRIVCSSVLLNCLFLAIRAARAISSRSFLCLRIFSSIPVKRSTGLRNLMPA